jgi:hypothetical protein
MDLLRLVALDPDDLAVISAHLQEALLRVGGIDQVDKDAVLNLLAISFDERDAPSGTATLIFAEGGAIQVDLECIEMQMKDIGPIWAAESRPSHEEQKPDGKQAERL